jgi:FHA domain
VSGIDPKVLEWELGSMSREEYVARHRYPFLLLVEELPCDDTEHWRFATTVEERSEGARTTPLRLFSVTRKKTKHFQGKVFVGRTNTNDIVLRDGRVSKLHAYFELDTAGRVAAIADAGSTNGTRLDGKALEPRVSTPIDLGQIVAFGPFVFSFISAADVHGLRSRLTIRQILAGVKGEARRA